MPMFDRNEMRDFVYIHLVYLPICRLRQPLDDLSFNAVDNHRPFLEINICSFAADKAATAVVALNKVHR